MRDQLPFLMQHIYILAEALQHCHWPFLHSLVSDVYIHVLHGNILWKSYCTKDSEKLSNLRSSVRSGPAGKPIMHQVTTGSKCCQTQENIKITTAHHLLGLTTVQPPPCPRAVRSDVLPSLPPDVHLGRCRQGRERGLPPL